MKQEMEEAECVKCCSFSGTEFCDGESGSSFDGDPSLGQ